MPKSVLLKDENGNIADIDGLTKHLAFIDIIHHLVHEGVMYRVTRVVEAVADDGTIEILIRTTANDNAHMRFAAQAGGDATLEIFEDPTVTDDGTGLTWMNRNRVSGNTATVLAFHTPTISADGTALPGTFLPGGTGGSAAGADQVSFSEWILKPSEEYLIRLTNISGNAKTLGLELDMVHVNQAEI